MRALQWVKQDSKEGGGREENEGMSVCRKVRGGRQIIAYVFAR